MSGLRECRRCLLLKSGELDAYKSVKEHIEKILPRDKRREEDYKKCLEICENCDFLISGTCVKCGCYIELRAAFKNSKCPMKLWTSERRS